MNIEVRRATSDDAGALANLYQQANAFKQAHGDNIWGDKPFTADEMLEMVGRGNTYVGLVAGSVAVAANLTWADAHMWGQDVGLDGQAGYIHQLASGDAYKGTGREMLTWLESRIYAEGRPFARLDCPADADILCGYYENAGYTRIGTAVLTNPYYYKLAYFQKTV